MGFHGIYQPIWDLMGYKGCTDIIKNMLCLSGNVVYPQLTTVLLSKMMINR